MHACHGIESQQADTSIGETAEGQSVPRPAREQLKRKAFGQSFDFEALLAEDERRATRVATSREVKRKEELTLDPVRCALKRPRLGPSLRDRLGGTPSTSSSVRWRR